MTGKFDYSQLEKIQSQCNIVSVISNYLTLTKKGKNYWGICPFHDDKNPSMSVSEDKQIYRCFSCNHAGNAFTFIRDFEKIPFLQAVKKAAQICNVSVPELDNIYEEKKISKEDAVAYSLLSDLLNYYTYNLRTSEGKKALDYLYNRKLSDDVINHFKIGYAPIDGKKTIDFLRAKGHNVEDMIKFGIAIRSSDGIVDPLRGRLIFPITNKDNKPIAFSGRILENDKNLPKYVNTQETELFHKSDILYNYYQANLHANKEKLVYIVEGFMDVIALYRSGINSCIATMGTALTSNHVKEIKKLIVPIRLLFDSDEAGQNATIRCMELFDGSNIKYQIVKPLKDYKDVDEAINKLGSEGLKNLLNIVYEPMDYRLMNLAKKNDLNNYSGKKEFIKQSVISLSKTIKDKIGIDYYLKKISDITLIELGIIKEEFNRIYRPPVIKINVTPVAKKSKQYSAKEQLHIRFIHIMLENINAIIRYQKNEVSLFLSEYEVIAIHILEYFKNHGKIPKPETLYSVINNQESINLLTEILDFVEKDKSLIDLEALIDEINRESMIYNIDQLIDKVTYDPSLNELERGKQLHDLNKQKKKYISK